MKLLEAEGIENITDRFYDYALTDKDIDNLPQNDSFGDLAVLLA